MATDLLSRMGSVYGFKLSEMFKQPERAEHIDTNKIFGKVTPDRTQSTPEFEAIKSSNPQGLGSDARLTAWAHSPIESLEVQTPLGLISTTERCSDSLRQHAKKTDDPAIATTFKLAGRELESFRVNCGYAREQVMTLQPA